MYIKLNRIKKIISLLCTALIILGCTVSAYADTSAPLYAKDIKDGVYDVEVESSSSMFRIVDCSLAVQGGEMTAVMTLSGTGYEKLYMGTGDEALDASEEDYIYFKEDEEGRYTYTIPVEALDNDTDCAAWSIRKQQWYDRTLVFKSDTLPENAIEGDVPVMPLIIIAVVIALAVFSVITINIKKKLQNSDMA